MFDKLPYELECKILFMAHPTLSKIIQNELKNHKFIKKNSLRFQHPFETLLFFLR